MTARMLGRDDLIHALDYEALINAIDDGFRSDIEMPVRHAHTIDRGGPGRDATLLLKPAWSRDYIGVKTLTFFPTNADKSLPAISASYQLMSGETGAVLALLDGDELTTRRTAAASALASRYLSRENSRHLLVVATGAMAPHLIGAHSAVRPIDCVTVWGRNVDKAKAVAAAAQADGFNATASDDLEGAVGDADIISCATPARDPLIKGAWMKPGQHLDLVGGFTPDMREADDDAIARARVYVDTRAGALSESGDLIQPLNAGVITHADVLGDLHDMARGNCPLRQSHEDVTFFKSTGAALEDLAAAVLAYERTGEGK